MIGWEKWLKFRVWAPVVVGVAVLGAVQIRVDLTQQARRLDPPASHEQAGPARELPAEPVVESSAESAKPSPSAQGLSLQPPPLQPPPAELGTMGESKALDVASPQTENPLIEALPSGPEAQPAKPLPLLKVPSIKQVLVADAQIIEDPVPPAMRMSLADYLRRELGPKRFHRRREWAGRGKDYAPKTYGGRVWKPIGEVRHLTIHHSEGVPLEHPASMIRNIYRGHSSPGGRFMAADVGYHFLVDRQGQIWEGRSASRLGTHVGSKPRGRNNRGNLGICGLGDFDAEHPPKVMTESIADLAMYIARYYGRRLRVRGHDDWVGANGFRPRGGVGCPARLRRAIPLAQDRIERDFPR